jgi:hypothetical protein
MAYQLQASGQVRQKGKSIVRILLILVFSPFLFEPPP